MKLRLATFSCLLLFSLSSNVHRYSSNLMQPVGTAISNPKYQQVLSFGHKKLPVQIVSWHPKDNRLAVAYQGYSSIEIFDANSGKLESTLDTLPYHSAPGVPANDLKWSPNGKYLAVAFETEITIWIVDKSPTKITTISTKGYGPSISWAADSIRLADVRGGDSSRPVNVWDVRNGKQVATFQSEEKAIAQVAWSPDGKLIAAWTYGGNMQLWDADSFTLSKTISGDNAGMFLQGPIVWRTNSQELGGVACGVGSCQFWLINVPTGQISSSPNINFIPGPVNSLAWAKDGRLLAGDDGSKTVEIFDVTANNLLQTLAQHSDFVTSVAWNFDGTRLATGSLDGSVLIWTQ